MATLKQKKAVGKLVENGGNISRSMRQAGYRPATAKNPKKLTESKGFKELCIEAGLTEQFILEALKEDIEKKPQRRKGELELATKVLGLYQEKHEINTPTTLTDILRQHASQPDKGEGETAS